MNDGDNKRKHNSILAFLSSKMSKYIYSVPPTDISTNPLKNEAVKETALSTIAVNPNTDISDDKDITSTKTIVQAQPEVSNSDHTFDASHYTFSFSEKSKPFYSLSQNDTIKKRRSHQPYKPAPVTLLSYSTDQKDFKDDELITIARNIEVSFYEFDIKTKIVCIVRGPSMTRFELKIASGTRISSILSLKRDIQLRLGVKSLEIEAPILGKDTIGIDIPNKNKSNVYLRNLVEKCDFKNTSDTTLILGLDITNKPLFCDLSESHHLLITGQDHEEIASIRDSIICEILCKSSPESIRMLMLDSTITELTPFVGIPHLIKPICSDINKISQIIDWISDEIQNRLSLFSANSAKALKDYNEICLIEGESTLPYIIVIVNELYDWDHLDKAYDSKMKSILFKGAIVGVHIVASFSANVQSRIFRIINNGITTKAAFSVASTDISKKIINYPGAESLNCKNDFLFVNNSCLPVRGTSPQIQDQDIEHITEHIKFFNKAYYKEYANDPQQTNYQVEQLLEAAVEVILEQKVASVSILQGRLGIGYPKAAKLIDLMEQKKYVGPFEGSKPRKVLITPSQWIDIKANK